MESHHEDWFVVILPECFDGLKLRDWGDSISQTSRTALQMGNWYSHILLKEPLVLLIHAAINSGNSYSPAFKDMTTYVGIVPSPLNKGLSS